MPELMYSCDCVITFQCGWMQWCFRLMFFQAVRSSMTVLRYNSVCVWVIVCGCDLPSG